MWAGMQGGVMNSAWHLIVISHFALHLQGQQSSRWTRDSCTQQQVIGYCMQCYINLQQHHVDKILVLSHTHL